MNTVDILQQTGALDTMASELGVDRNTAQTAATALLPEILAGFGKSAGGAPAGGAAGGLGGALGGLGGLGSLIGALGGGSLLDSVIAPKPTPVEKGNDVLGQIFGSKEVSRSVAADASNQTGISPELLKKMLPILAMVVAGYLAKQNNQGSQGGAGGLGGLLGGLMGGLGR